MPRPISGSKRRTPNGNWELRLRGESWTIPESDSWPESRAQAELDGYVAQARAGVFRGFPRFVVPTDGRGRFFEEAAADYVERIRTRSRSKTAVAYGKPSNQNDKEWRVAHLLPFFSGRRIGDISLDLIHTYTRWQLDNSEALVAKREGIRAKRAAAAEARRVARLAARKLHDVDEREAARAAADAAFESALTPEEATWWRENHNRKGLDASSVNKTLQTLGTILEAEMKRHPGVLPFNWARDEEVRLPEEPPDRFTLSLDQLVAFLEAARALDATNRSHHSSLSREAMFAFQLFTGVRISEQLEVPLRNIDRANGHVYIDGTKTAAARGRRIPIHPGLKPILWRYMDEVTPGRPAEAKLFATNNGGRRTKDRYNDQIERVIPEANALLRERGQRELPPRFTSHAFRRTYVTMMAELGENQAEVMRRIGHGSASLTLQIYNQIGNVGRMANDERLVELFGPRGYDGFASSPQGRAT